jgi:hypothetical protein
LAKLASDYGVVTAKAAQADAATGGGDAKAGAETVLEDAAFILTRARRSLQDPRQRGFVASAAGVLERGSGG